MAESRQDSRRLGPFLVAIIAFVSMALILSGGWTATPRGGVASVEIDSAQHLVKSDSDPLRALHDGVTSPDPRLPGPVSQVVRYLSGVPQWTNLTDPTAPPTLDYAAMAFDPVANYTLLFGGQSAGGYPTNQTWVFAGGSWTNITNNVGEAPIPRDGMAMTYDSADHYILAYGGGGFTLTCSRSSADSCDTTWAFYSGLWHIVNASGTLPQVSMQFSMAFDASDGYVLGTDGSHTWEYLGGTWTPFCGTNCTNFIPAPDVTGAVAYDAHDGYVLFTGDGFTWKFHSGTWTNISGASGAGPSSRQYFDVASNTANGSVLVFGGLASLPGGRFGYLNDTWIFSDGSWDNVSVGLAPSGRYGAALAFDPPENGYVLFGGDSQLGSGGDRNDTWFYGPHAPISELSLSLDPPVPQPGENASFTATFNGGTGPFSYSWIFGDGGLSALASPVHSFASVGFYVVSVWVNDSLGDRATGSIRVHVFVPLSVLTLSASPNPVILGQPVNFSVTPTGGSPPYTVSWAFGDGGVGGNLTNITHIFTTDGPFTVVATVSDSAGDLVRSELNLSIQLQALAGVSQTSASDPFTIHFIGQAQGGVGPYSFDWSFGDGTVARTQDPAHTYSGPGSYSVSLIVTDAKGDTSESNLSVQVGVHTQNSTVTPSTVWLWPAVLGAAVVAAAGLSLTAVLIVARERRQEGEEWIRKLTSDGSEESGVHRPRG
jgi:PKD repeat protein